MKELRPKEEKWLRIFAEEDKFFTLLLEFYHENNQLKDDDYSKLKIKINDAEERGWKLLSLEAIKILGEHARVNKNMLDLLENYDKKGYLDDAEYVFFKEYLEEDGYYDQLFDDDDSDDELGDDDDDDDD